MYFKLELFSHDYEAELITVHDEEEEKRYSPEARRERNIKRKQIVTILQSSLI